jgi:LPXTG-motif cell wall-anchored protein
VILAALSAPAFVAAQAEQSQDGQQGAEEPAAPPAEGPPDQPAEAPSPAAQPPTSQATASPRTTTTKSAAPQQQQQQPRPVAVAAGPGSVSIADFSFSPGSITVNVGDTVTWTNQGPSGHSATAGGNFDTGIIPAGSSASHTFNAAGTFDYICTPHPFMHGTVKVVASSSGGGSNSGGDSNSGGGNDSSSGGPSAGGGSQQSGGAGSSGVVGTGAGLPNSGADSGLLALAGLAFLGVGLTLRRRIQTR